MQDKERLQEIKNDITLLNSLFTMSIGRYQGRGLSFSTSLGLGPEYDHDHF